MDHKTYAQLSEKCRRHIDAAILVDAAHAIANPYASSDPRSKIAPGDVAAQAAQLRTLYTDEMQQVSPRFASLTKTRKELDAEVDSAMMAIALGDDYKPLEGLLTALGLSVQDRGDTAERPAPGRRAR